MYICLKEISNYTNNEKQCVLHGSSICGRESLRFYSHSQLRLTSLTFYSKTNQNMVPRLSKRVLKSAKDETRPPRSKNYLPNSFPRHRQTLPRRLKDVSNTAPDGSKTAPHASTTPPGRLKIASRPFRDAPIRLHVISKTHLADLELQMAPSWRSKNGR